MQIILQQSEIAKALKLYIVKQGINTSGKDVSMSFTAGRKEQGISVQINIEDADIPGFGSEDPEFEAPIVVTEASEPAPVVAPVTQLRAAPELPADPPFHTEETAAETKPAKKTVGSFLPESIPPVINKKLEAVEDTWNNPLPGPIPEPVSAAVSEPTEAVAEVGEPKKTVSLFS